MAAGAVLYPLLRRVRPALVAFFGMLALTGGWPAHVTKALDGDAAGGDYTGVLYALAGIVLIALALKLILDLLRARRARSVAAR